MTVEDPVGWNAQTRTLIAKKAGELLTKVSTLREIMK